MSNLAQRNGWCVQSILSEDGSARRYERVSKGDKTAVFMNVYGDTPGHRLHDFVRIGDWLREIGLSAPEIYELDEAAGQALIEDFGDVSFRKAPDYPLAGQVLDHLAAQNGCPMNLPSYRDSHVHAARDLIIRWYVPALRGEAVPEDMLAEYLAVWDGIERTLPPCPEGFLHIDFHAENLMVLPDREGVRACGILDFQGAMIGPQPYDLVNLLEDMRTDVPQDMQTALLKDKDEVFLAWYRVLGTQFHCRLVGQCVRWAVRDNKPAYMNYMPRLFGYLNKALGQPVLRPLQTFFKENGINFEQSPVFEPKALQALIQEQTT